MVLPSFNPMWASLGVVPLALSLFIFIKGGMGWGVSSTLAGGALGVISWSWWRDVVGESQHLGSHTKSMETLLTFGFLMFVLSEACLFLSIFWSYLHNALAPTLELGAIWPPLGVSVLDPYGAPYLNTVVLLSSGITMTLAHAKHSAVAREGGAFWVYLTVVLGALFTLVQASEYFSAEYSISDSIFGSLFFFGTGFHGAHVLVGSGFLLYVAVRFSQKHSSPGKGFISLDFAAWYWHFVDVIWIYLFFGLYLMNF